MRAEEGVLEWKIDQCIRELNRVLLKGKKSRKRYKRLLELCQKADPLLKNRTEDGEMRLLRSKKKISGTLGKYKIYFKYDGIFNLTCDVYDTQNRNLYAINSNPLKFEHKKSYIIDMTTEERKIFGL